MGRTMAANPLDPRTSPFRPDLAATALRHVVTAPRYADPRPMEVVADLAPVLAEPDPGAGLVTQALFGESVAVYEDRDGWSWVQLGTDDYIGYLRSSDLGPTSAGKNHKVSALRTYRYSRADLKSPPLGLLSHGSPRSVVGRTDEYFEISGGGFVHGGHICELDHAETDFVAVAERFSGAPYLWGGRSSIGLDCSALVQLALAAAGVSAPRDSDMQMVLGRALPVPGPDLQGLSRGDLIFWRGHLGIMTDEMTLLHANAHHMEVAREPVTEAVRRIGASGLQVIGARRLRAGLDR